MHVPDAVQAVVFDYGGVLTVAGRVALARWTETERIRPETLSTALKDWLSRSAPPGTPIHRLETGELSARDFERVLAARLRTVDDGPVEPEGLLGRIFSNMGSDPAMHALVQDVRAGGVRTAMLSNSWGNSYPWDELDGLFEFSVISGDIGLRKPDAEIYLHTLSRLGLAPHEVVFVDDAAPNTEAAEQLGIHAIRHESAETTRARLAAFLPDLATVEERR